MIGPKNQSPTMGTQYLYDSLGRSASVTSSIVGGIGAGLYTSSTTYDSFSRPQTQTYPKNGLKLRYEYSTSSGQMITTKEATTGQVLWQLAEQNASGQLVKSTLGGKINRQFNYDDDNRLTQIQASVGATSRQNWQVQYDAMGNVVQRKDVLTGFTESFAFDNLNRMTLSHGASVADNSIPQDIQKLDTNTIELIGTTLFAVAILHTFATHAMGLRSRHARRWQINLGSYWPEKSIAHHGHPVSIRFKTNALARRRGYQPTRQ